MTKEKAAEIKTMAESAVAKMFLIVGNIVEQETSKLADEEKELFYKYFLAGYGGMIDVAENDESFEIEDAGEFIHNVIDVSKMLYDEVYQTDQNEENS